MLLNKISKPELTTSFWGDGNNESEKNIREFLENFKINIPGFSLPRLHQVFTVLESLESALLCLWHYADYGQAFSKSRNIGCGNSLPSVDIFEFLVYRGEVWGLRRHLV